MRSTSTPEFRLRPYREDQPDELEFLYQLYATTRADEMRQLLDWTDEQKEAFVRSQFQLQHDHYTKNYPGATFDVVVHDDERIGRLYVYRVPSEIRLMEVTLLPEWRKRGIGGALTREILCEAADSDRPVVLHVESWNPAVRLYERLGFVKTADVGINLRMEWRPGAGRQGRTGSSPAAE